MSIEDIFKMISGANVNMEEVLNAIKSLNYSDFSNEDLEKLREKLNTFLDSTKPKLNVKCWSDFIILGLLFIISLWIPVCNVITKIYGCMMLISISIQMRKYFKIKNRYYSKEGVMQVARDALESINDILTFRKRKSEAIDLEDIRVVQSDKVESKVESHDLNYLYKLIGSVNVSLNDLSGDYKVYVNLRFNDALRSLDNIDSQESLDMVVAEFERIADIIVELQQEEQDLPIEVGEEKARS